MTDYLPRMALLDVDVPVPDAIAGALGGGTVEVLPVPLDCGDGFCHSWWHRPEAYLQAEVRAGISGIARLPPAYVADAMERLAADLASRRWHDRHADLLSRREIDAGYRLVTAPG